MQEAEQRTETNIYEVDRIIKGPCAQAAKGKQVAVVCKNLWDQTRKAEAVFCALKGVGTLSRFTIIFPSGGSVEFTNLHCASGRRADDFDHHAFML